ncbi:MAG: outer membrane protein assembly factor BamC [Rheinheimera sp.]|nr:outer membrane protein assembly factor BamC [Rheinheimera sp.]
MQQWVKGSVVASILLTGCSLFQTEQTETDVKTETNGVAVLQVPTGLQQPAKPGKFDIPPTAAQHSTTDTRSPALVLATASSSRVEEGDKLVRVWFDRNDYTGELVPFLQQMLQAQFAEQGVELQQDDSGLSFTTGWISRFEDNGFWFWSSAEQTEQARFRIVIEPKPHGRSASMTVTMLEHQYFTDEAKLTAQSTQRQEAALLNQIIDRVGKQEITIARANKSKAPDVFLEPGMDAEGNPALLTTQPIDVTWSQLESLFDALNMTVTDKNRSIYTYYVDYEQPQQGMWSKFWGSEAKPVLPVANGEYQLVLTRAGKHTAISLRDNSGAHLAAETVVALYEPFVQAIKMARVEL